MNLMVVIEARAKPGWVLNPHTVSVQLAWRATFAIWNGPGVDLNVLYRVLQEIKQWLRALRELNPRGACCRFRCIGDKRHGIPLAHFCIGAVSLALG